jgi:putative DNA primase/helicase
MGAFKDLSLRLSGASPSAARSIKSQFIREQSGERFDGVLNAFSLARLLGGEAQGDQILAPGPGDSARDRSLSILIDPTAPDGFTCHSFAGDDWADCKDYVLAEIEKALVARMNAAHDRQLALTPEESAAELELWKAAPDDFQGRPIDFGNATPPRRADPVHDHHRAVKTWERAAGYTFERVACDYLASRGLKIPKQSPRYGVAPKEIGGRVLRYTRCGATKNKDGDLVFRPMIVARVADIRCDDDESIGFQDDEYLITVHRILLVGDDNKPIVKTIGPNGLEGPKVTRKFLSSPVGGAIKLTPHKEIMRTGELTIGEGVETCLAAMQLGFKNVWSLINSNGIKDLPVIPGVKLLTILCENDDRINPIDGSRIDGANRIARTERARRWYAAGIKVILEFPTIGKDFNDQLVLKGVAK